MRTLLYFFNSVIIAAGGFLVVVSGVGSTVDPQTGVLIMTPSVVAALRSLGYSPGYDPLTGDYPAVYVVLGLIATVGTLVMLGGCLGILRMWNRPAARESGL